MIIQIFLKVSLSSLPTSLLLLETKKDSELVVGLQEGSIVRINTLDI